MRQGFRISDIAIELNTPEKLILTEGFDSFLSEDTPKYHVIYQQADQLPRLIKERYLCREGIAEIFSDESGEFLRAYYPDQENCQIYAVRTADYSQNRIRIDYLPWGKKFVNEMQNAFYHIALEELLIHEKRMILHASLVKTPLGGIIFTGRSGVGKSTQGDLWVKYGNGRILNGDRTILHRNEDCWWGYGSPYAGSSRYYVNEGVSISGIAVLSHGLENRVERLEGLSAFRALYSGVTVNTWNHGFVDEVCNLLEKLIQEVPVYSLTCTPTKEAVDIFAQVMKGGD